MKWLIGASMTAFLLGALLGFALCAEAASQNVITWTDNSTNEAKFNLERKAEVCTGTGTFSPLASVGANVTTYTDTAVVEGTYYCYRVNAENSAGASGWSPTAGRLVPFTVPPAPTGLTVAGTP